MALSPPVAAPLHVCSWWCVAQLAPTRFTYVLEAATDAQEHARLQWTVTQAAL